ncbi:MAG: hypothetical protein AAB316_14205 [Bacteroidota bacterium]
MNALAFQVRLDSNVIHLPPLKSMIGKNVIITIVEVPAMAMPKKKIWRYIGSVNLGGQLDNLNIRDLAYD